MLAEIASSVPIPLNINIIVRLLLLLVISENEINKNVYWWIASTATSTNNIKLLHF